MDIFDRGTKKWTAMMLPEHVAMLKDTGIDYHRSARPSLDEFQQQEIDEKINTAVEFRLPVELLLWFDGFEEELTGVIKCVDEIDKQFRIVDIKGEVTRIDYDSIIGIDFADS